MAGQTHEFRGGMIDSLLHGVAVVQVCLTACVACPAVVPSSRYARIRESFVATDHMTAVWSYERSKTKCLESINACGFCDVDRLCGEP